MSIKIDKKEIKTPVIKHAFEYLMTLANGNNKDKYVALLETISLLSSVKDLPSILQIMHVLIGERMFGVTDSINNANFEIDNEEDIKKFQNFIEIFISYLLYTFDYLFSHTKSSTSDSPILDLLQNDPEKLQDYLTKVKVPKEHIN